MQAPKTAIIGAVVLIVAVIAGLGIWMANNNNEDKEQKTSQTQKEDTTMEEKTITGLAAGNDDLSTLVAAVTAADLAGTLDDKDAEVSWSEYSKFSVLVVQCASQVSCSYGCDES